MAQTHICGLCQEQFNNVDQYNDHECAATGFTPKQPEHLGEDFKAVSEAAIERGNKRANK